MSADAALVQPPELVGVVFSRKGQYGDFSAMLPRPEHGNDVFIFCDNVVDGLTDAPHDGAGSAAIRTSSHRYGNASLFPRAFGVPTGFSPTNGAFLSSQNGALQPFAARAIVLAIERIVTVIGAHPGVGRIFYPISAHGDDRLGCGTFNVSSVVLEFVTSKLKSLPERIVAIWRGVEPPKFSVNRLLELEEQVAHVAKLECENAALKRLKRPTSGHQLPPAKMPAAEKRYVRLREPVSEQKQIEQRLHLIGKGRDGYFVYELPPPPGARQTLFRW